MPTDLKKVQGMLREWSLVIPRNQHEQRLLNIVSYFHHLPTFRHHHQTKDAIAIHRNRTKEIPENNARIKELFSPLLLILPPFRNNKDHWQSVNKVPERNDRLHPFKMFVQG